jgi:hypothetical protein
MNVYVAIGENIFKDSGKCINEKTLGVFKNQRAAEYFILDFHEKLCLTNKKKYRKSENTMINGDVCFSLSFETETNIFSFTVREFEFNERKIKNSY